MDRLTILFCFMLISYAACDVDIAAPGPIPLTHGQSYKLRCKVTAPDTFDRWDNPAIKIPVKDDPNLVYEQDGDEHDLTITSLNLTLSGVWTCYSKQGKSDNLTLILTPSEVTLADKLQYLIKDQPGTIYVDIRGNPTPDFEWQRDGVALNITGRYSVASNGTLFISKVETGDAGTYEVEGSKNFFNKQIDGIVVEIRVAPSLNGTSIQESRTLGGNISFECSASGVPTPSITWEKDSKEITDSGRFAVSASGLRITDIKEEDVGNYTCVARNVAGIKTLISTLVSVYVPPEITAFSPKQEVEKGTTLNVSCDATGTPPPTVEWSKDGNALSTSQQTMSPGKSILTLTNIQTSQGGVYECSAKNDAVDVMGKVIVKKQSLEVNIVYPPEFQNVVETINVRLNEPTTISCDATGMPQPAMNLSYGSNILQARTTSTSNLSSLIYKINKTSVDDLGKYTCTASSRLNNIQTTITLNVPLDKPEISIVNLECNNVTFSWTHDTKMYIKVSEYQLTMKKNDDQTLVKTKVVSSNTSRMTFSGLEESTKYDLAVKQVIDVNIGQEASLKMLTTSKCPLKKINSAVASGNAVTIYWPEASVSVDKYVIKYRVKGSTDEWTKKETERIFIKIIGLDYGTEYEFQVYYVQGSDETPHTEIRDVVVPAIAVTTKQPENATSATAPQLHTIGTTTATKEPEGTGTVGKPPGKVARQKGLSGGAIAAIVIVIILLVLIAVDIFCCFFNQCGVVHMCAAACAGKKREKYNVDGSPEEGTKLKSVDENGHEEPEA